MITALFKVENTNNDIKKWYKAEKNDYSPFQGRKYEIFVRIYFSI